MPTTRGGVPKMGIPRLDELVELCEAHGQVMQVAPRYLGAGWQVDVTLYASDPFMADLDTEAKARRWLAAKALELLDAVEAGGWQVDADAGFTVKVEEARPPYGPRHPRWERLWGCTATILLAE